MHLIRRAAFRAAASPAVSARSFSTRMTVSPFRVQVAQSSKLTAITFRRFASDDATDKELDQFADVVSEETIFDGESTPEPPPSVAAMSNQIGSGPPYSRGVRPVIPPNRSIYVGNLQFDVTEEALKREFEEFGVIKSATLALEPKGLSKGFGYVEFETVESATAAIEARNQTVYEGRRMIVNYQSKSSTRSATGSSPPTKTLFIGNLAFEMSDADLNKLFRDIRNVIDVRVAIDRRTGQPRGFAHADFTDVESAEKAMEVLQNKDVYGRTLRVDFSASKAPRLGVFGAGRGDSGRDDSGEYGNDNGRPSF